MNGYNTRTGKITLEPGASLYTKFHEIAHKEQHTGKTIFFQLMLLARYIPVASYFADLWIEFDAMNRARRVMRYVGVWDNAVDREAWKMFKTYLWRRGT